MNMLTLCREGIEKVRLLLAADKLLNRDEMEQALAVLKDCENQASGHGSVLMELRTAHLKVTRCDVKGEFVDFLEAQYRGRGLSSPRKIATLVVLEEATNALKRASAASMEQLRRSSAA